LYLGLIIKWFLLKCPDAIYVAMQRFRHNRQSTNDATKVHGPDPSIPGPSMTGASHNYFLLEKHERDTANIPIVTVSNENPYYSSPLIVDNYEDPDAVRETNFGTADVKNERVTGKPMSSPSGNVYNTFKQFQQQQEDYDHLSDHHRKPPQVTDNVYSTTHNVMTIPAIDDTYHHLGQFPGATSRPDNVYGMPRVDDNYDRMPHVNRTQASATIPGGADNYFTFNKKF